MPISQTVKKHITLNFVNPVLFDRYAGDFRTKLTPEQKLYVLPDKTIYLPAENIFSFLTAQNTESAPKLLLDKREYKTICSALQASLTIMPEEIPFLRKGKKIKFGGFTEEDGTYDPISGARVTYHVARLDKGIPNPKERPRLDPELSLEFDITLFPHSELSLEMVEDLFTRGGAQLGLGTYRKRFGKFEFSWK